MLDMLFIFTFGVVLGILGVLAIQKLYEWIEGLSSRVRSLRWELERCTIERELWYEFNDWKRMQKGKE